MDSAGFDLDSYLDLAINTKFEDLKFHWDSCCTICLTQFSTYQELLEHILHRHHESQEFACVLEDCTHKAPTEYLLARHLVLKHCNLESLKIYSICPHCDTRFSNLIDFNKHSCCRTIKWKTGTPNYCEACEEQFPSFKRYIFHMQFHSEKPRPKVCLVCDSCFTDAASFFEHVQYGHEPPESLACIRCDRVFKDRNAFEAHKSHHKVQYKYECNYCLKKYDHKSLLTSHLEIYHNDKSSDLQCDICSKVFRKQASLQKHLRMHTIDTDIQVHVCVQCGLIGQEESDVLSHVVVDAAACTHGVVEEEVVSAAYTCEYCALDFKTPDDLRAHRTSGVHKDGVFYCNFCDFRFDQFKKLRIHISTHPSYLKLAKAFPLKRLFMCDHKDCSEAYVLWASLYSHKRVHKRASQVIDSVCPFCAKQYPTKMSLSVHIARSHNNKNLNCPHCKYLYKDEDALRKHIDQFHLVAACSCCHKTFKNRRNLEIHERNVHANDQRFFCQYCNKGYFHRSECNAHEKNVHQNVLYECTSCGFSTKYANSLEVHMAAHKNELQYQCPLCGKCFGRKSVLTLHIRRHNVDMQYLCANRIVDGCDAAFVSNSQLNKHIAEKHSNYKLLEPPAKRTCAEATTASAPAIVYPYEEVGLVGLTDEDVDDPEEFQYLVDESEEVDSVAELYPNDFDIIDETTDVKESGEPHEFNEDAEYLDNAEMIQLEDVVDELLNDSIELCEE